MKKIRRDTLLRMAKAGKLVDIGSYHFDDMTGESRMDGKALPVRIKSGAGDFVEGFFNLLERDFKSTSGGSYLSDDGMTAHLYVHSNCNYDFRKVDGTAFDHNEKTAKAHRPENERMQRFLADNGIEATPKYLHEGSMRGAWRLYNSSVAWTMDLAEKLNGLGFTSWDGEPLGRFSGNGGTFCCFVRGHNEFLSEPVTA